MFVFAAALLAQAARGAIAGRVTTDQDDAASGVTVQAKDMAGKISSVVANKNGEFRLTNLPAGIYEISVPQMGVRTARFAQPNVTIEAGKTLTFNIKLMPNNFGIIGDDGGFLHIYNKYANQKVRLLVHAMVGRIFRASGSRTWIPIRRPRKCVHGRNRSGSGGVIARSKGCRRRDAFLWIPR